MQRKEINSFRLSDEPTPLRLAYQDLKSAFQSKQPLIFIDTYDYETVDGIIIKLATDLKKEDGTCLLDIKNVHEYIPYFGEVSFDTKESRSEYLMEKRPASSVNSLYNFLFDYVSPDIKFKYNPILLIRNISSVLEAEPSLIELLRAIAGNNIMSKKGMLYIVITAPKIMIPSQLVPFASMIKLPKPEMSEVVEIIKGWINDNIPEQLRGKRLDKVKEIAPHLCGFCGSEIVQILNKTRNSGTNESVRIIKQSKKDMVTKTGFLKLCEPSDDFAGLQNLRHYLEEVKLLDNHSREAREVGIPKSKGILLVGMPGCGKSLVSKVVASKNYLNRPLIQLDIGRLLGKYVGQSDANLRLALDIAEGAAPCVLWIDELEKSFAGVMSESKGEGNGVMLRLFGSFLTWLQENRSDVFVIATANSIEAIPDELKRKGRFDMIFRIMMPSKEERADIFRYHFNMHKPCMSFTDDDFKEFAEATSWGKEDDGFSGADIANIVNSALRASFLNKCRAVENSNITEAGDFKIDKATVLEEIKKLKTKSQRDIMGNEKYGKLKKLLEESGYQLASVAG